MRQLEEAEAALDPLRLEAIEKAATLAATEKKVREYQAALEKYQAQCRKAGEQVQQLKLEIAALNAALEAKVEQLESKDQEIQNMLDHEQANANAAKPRAARMLQRLAIGLAKPPPNKLRR